MRLNILFIVLFIPLIYSEALGADKDQTAWRTPDSSNLLILELNEGEVWIELAPQFAPKHVANIKQFVKQGFFDDSAVVRSQENYVVQWGDPAQSDANKRSLEDAQEKLSMEFYRDKTSLNFQLLNSRDAYAKEVGFVDGFPVAGDGEKLWLAHCNAMVGVGRGLEADSGNGSSLYAVIGHAPRHLDRNVTLVGRVIKGMERLSTLPRGTQELGFYSSSDEQVSIRSITLASEGEQELDIEILRTSSVAFREHIAARTSRQGDWFVEPTNAIELCNVGVPSRLKQQSQ